MNPRHTYASMMTVLRSHVDSAWLDGYMSTPDGAVVVGALIDSYVAVDGRNADMAASLLVRPSPGAVGDPAARATFATTTLELRRLRPAPTTHVMRAGTQVQTKDGHIFTTDADVVFPAGDVNIPRSVPATALVSGWMGVIPPQEINAFVKVANGANGVGVSITIEASFIDGEERLVLTTDVTQPDLFRSTYIGLYAEITQVPSAGPELANLGKQMQIAITGGASLAPGVAPPIEDQRACSFNWNHFVDIEFADWFTGTFSYIWTVRDWDDLGYVVTNTSAVVGGVDPVLDEKATARGRPPLPGETTDSLRARVLTKPNPPDPIGLLRKCILAVRQFGFGRKDLTIYEAASTPPDVVDPYAENFPAWGGFIGNLHCGNMSSPVTPDGMVAYTPTYVVILGTIHNSGLCLPLAAAPQKVVLVDFTTPIGYPDELRAQALTQVYPATRNGVARGTLFEIYNEDQWGF